MRAGRFAVIVFVSALATLAAALAAMLLVDPYGIHGAPLMAGFNEVKPASSQHAWLAKAARAHRSRPALLLLGNSRTDVGLDPRSDAWPATPSPVFNFGVPGSGIATQPGVLDDISVEAPPKMLVIGVEFLDFLPRRGAGEASARPADFTPTLHLDVRSFVQTSLSLSALADSLYTVIEQYDANAAQMTPLGFNPFREFRAHVAREGHAALAAQKNESNFHHLLALDGARWSPLSIAALREQLRGAARLHVPVVLFTYPYHAEMLESMVIAGLWPALEAWKGLLTDVVAQERRRADNLDVRLWDFTGYSTYSVEPFPPAGDTRTRMRWFWEPGHFKAELGDVMIRRMFDDDGGAEFGVPLTRATLPARNAAVAAAARAWRVREPAVSERLDALAERIRGGGRP